MSFKLDIFQYKLIFKTPAGTSRGVYHTRNVWYVRVQSIHNPGKVGIGECAPLPDLSCDNFPDYQDRLLQVCRQTVNAGCLDRESLRDYPSMLFGLETAFLNYERGSYQLFDTPFSRGESGIKINGLIWMNTREMMFKQIKEKLDAGFGCLKLKIGAIDFDAECSLLQYIRNHFTASQIELRVDANGTFSPADALEKLKRLSDFDLHSIEQPIQAGQWAEMNRLCELSPIPIALDEELIGCNNPKMKVRLLDTIRPQYIILKPSLHGGISGSNEWIELAGQRNIPHWITSALESNIGLNAIAQWCATTNPVLPQGLGTGQLFTNNIPMPLEIRRDCLWYNNMATHAPFNPETL